MKFGKGQIRHWLYLKRKKLAIKYKSGLFKKKNGSQNPTRYTRKENQEA